MKFKKRERHVAKIQEVIENKEMGEWSEQQDERETFEAEEIH